jgi:hypothetical protein
MTISEALDMCLKSHAQWKQRLKAAAEARRSDVSVADAGRDTVCEFGKWLHGEAQQLAPALKGTDLAQVQKLHREFHRCAGETLGFALAGDQAKYAAAIGLDGSFAKASITLMSAVNAWKARARS